MVSRLIHVESITDKSPLIIRLVLAFVGGFCSLQNEWWNADGHICCRERSPFMYIFMHQVMLNVKAVPSTVLAAPSDQTKPTSTYYCRAIEHCISRVKAACDVNATGALKE
ncbi:uncharacterized protein EI90DRAFT_3159676 [Cantharellus anzutake]|uniref:uncharacterized protein n=1 Tax=Cantharellus anzutake TaxID=1750568 RepID=UPI001906E38E